MKRMVFCLSMLVVLLACQSTQAPGGGFTLPGGGDPGAGDGGQTAGDPREGLPPEQVAASGPAVIVQAYLVALNLHDVETALSFFAEDGVIEVPGGFRNEGKDDVRDFLQKLVNRNVVIQVINDFRVDGDFVHYRTRMALLLEDGSGGYDVGKYSNRALVFNGLIYFIGPDDTSGSTFTLPTVTP